MKIDCYLISPLPLEQKTAPVALYVVVVSTQKTTLDQITK
jgi:hypothetical protein